MKRMDRSEKFWDKQAESYTRPQQSVELAENKDYRTVLKYLDINDTVLDYGCAGGIVANAITDKAKEVHGIDISPRMIEIARAHASERGIKNIHYAQGTIFDESYEKESFNMILAFRILHMLEDLPAVIRRMNDLLKPGGIFISVTTCMGWPWALLRVPLFLLRKTGILPLHVNFLRLSELQGLIAGEGFEIVEYERMDDRVPTYCVVARKPQG
jgi:2-polyprenyl-3-methyl-5-hydroxy-6-metoxy-1,4-benzoquinol methylase